MMKRISLKVLALVLAFALCMTLGMGALADTEITNDSTDNTANTIITYTVTDGYTVVIPSSVTIPSGATSTTLGVILKKGAIFPTDKWLCVYLDDSINDFKLKTKDDDAISYSVKKQSGSLVQEGSWICRNSALQLASKDNEIQLTLTLTGTATAPGEYSDILTFRVTLEDAST